MERMGRSTSFKSIFGTVVLGFYVMLYPGTASSQTIPESLASLQAQSEEISAALGSATVSVDYVNRYITDLEQVISLNSVVYEQLETQIRLLRAQAENELSGIEGTVAGAGPRYREIQNRIDRLEQQLATISVAAERMRDLQRESEERRAEIEFLVRVQEFDRATVSLQEAMDGLEAITDSLQSISESELNRLEIDIPGALDCPGPGCPLGS